MSETLALVKHTPGPWSVSPVGRSVYGSRTEVSYDASPYTPRICDCVYGGKNDEQLQANACLIAAAPDLMEALDLICRDYCPACGCDLKNTPGCNHCGLIQRGMTAIRKAKGEV